MPTPAPSSSSNQHPSELERGAHQTTSNKGKAVHIRDPQQPAVPQGDSSVISLTRHSLRELRRQNTQAAQESRAKQRVRCSPVTRLAVAEWKKRHRPLEPAYKYLKDCGHERYRALQSFSKHGGPDLRDLRGVWISNASRMLVLTMPLSARERPIV